VRYLSKKSFAKQLDVSVRTIDRWIAQRRISTRTFVTGGVRIPSSELDKCFKSSIQQFLDESKC